jgi:Stage II sporulation protein E (SpoIIE)/7TM diverse intracellular signalling
MFVRTSTSLRTVSLVLLLMAAAYGSQAQVFDLRNSHPATIRLDGLWRFHLGDDPQGTLGWADPAFDDANWPLLRSDVNWRKQGYKNYTAGYAWYRFKVILPETQKSLAICIPLLRTSYQIFADGKLIGQFGGMPPHGEYIIDFDHIFPLPLEGRSSGHVLSIAIRVWQMGGFANAGGGPEGAATIGELDALKDLKTQDDRSRFWSIASGNTLMSMNLLAAFAGFFLFWMRPADREYLWFALYELLTGVAHLLTDWQMFYPSGWKIDFPLGQCLASASWLFFLLFVFRILNGRRNWLFWTAIGTVVASLPVSVAGLAQWFNFDQWVIVRPIYMIPYYACILSLLYRRARQGVPDAQLMLVPVAICYISWFTEISLIAFNALGQSWVSRDFRWFFQLSRWPFPFSFQDVADMLMLLAVLAVLPLRFARSRRDEERLSAEMESARTVQQVLIPNEIPPVPGFEIQCVYKPAGFVGGDFFQIIPIATGGALIAIGDVSGKGMPAAMTVSLLVGTLRTLAHYTQSPSEILASMNQRMLARGQGGFTTCLVLRVAEDGTLTVANAGHLAPYLQGEELQVENGLPLGLVAESVYPETTFKLAENKQLTLVTDGVVEARSRTGELLGFERAAVLSNQTAESIAQAAQTFGQEDDITVLTVACRSPEAQPKAVLPAALSGS